MIQTTIIGFGNVGRALCLLLMNSGLNISINIMDPSNEIEGSVLEMQHSLAILSQVEIHINSNDHFQNADYIFHTAGACNSPNQSRLSVALR